MKIIDRWQRRCAVGLGLLLLVAAAQAQTNPFAKGPDPTSASLNATAGPFAVATTSVSSLVTGFGGGTIYYPSTAGSYAAVAICPGFTATQSSIAWIGRRMALAWLRRLHDQYQLDVRSAAQPCAITRR